jgi:queuine/archaeosine tRNA-ribosyltransferase
MADIYIAYAKEDRVQAEWLYNLLAQQWEAWWDDHLVGNFAMVIEKEIGKAKCVVAMFSESSRVKSTFTDELRLSEKHKIELLPLRLDNSDPPYSFGGYSYTELRDWDGQVDHPGILQLQRHIAKIVPPKAKPQRPKAIAGGRVLLPSLFMSVSSHETQLIPSEAVEALRAFNAPTILVSAYDLVTRRKPEKMIEELHEYRKNGGFILVDSGNYEKSRLGTKHWSPKGLEEALAQTPHDWVFAFDAMKTKHDPDKAIEEIINGVERDKTFTTAPVLPIVHAPAKKKGGYKLDTLPYVMREVSSKLQPPIIAVPERELGAGLVTRAKSVRAIREELDKLPYYQPLHILGTGNPWSIALLAAAGADSFDGLEWCRFVIDRDKEKLHHFQHYDFFTDQSVNSLFVKEALADANIGYAGKVAFHNLDYFSEFIDMMRAMFMGDKVEAFLVGLLGKKAIADLKEQFPELLQ